MIREKSMPICEYIRTIREKRVATLVEYLAEKERMGLISVQYFSPGNMWLPYKERTSSTAIITLAGYYRKLIHPEVLRVVPSKIVIAQESLSGRLVMGPLYDHAEVYVRIYF